LWANNILLGLRKTQVIHPLIKAPPGVTIKVGRVLQVAYTAIIPHKNNLKISSRAPNLKIIQAQVLVVEKLSKINMQFNKRMMQPTVRITRKM
jgi:hypothetical protein